MIEQCLLRLAQETRDESVPFGRRKLLEIVDVIASSELGKGLDLGRTQIRQVQVAGAQRLDKAEALDVRENRCGCRLGRILLEAEEARPVIVGGDAKQLIDLVTERAGEALPNPLEGFVLSVSEDGPDDPFKSRGSRQALSI